MDTKRQKGAHTHTHIKGGDGKIDSKQEDEKLRGGGIWDKEVKH